MNTLKAVDYQCQKCGHKQTITYFYEDSPLASTCCVNCRAGFEGRPGGMIPTGPSYIVQQEKEVQSIAEAIEAQ